MYCVIHSIAHVKSNFYDKKRIELLEIPKAALATTWIVKSGVNAMKIEKIMQITYGANLSVITMENQQPSHYNTKLL